MTPYPVLFAVRILAEGGPIIEKSVDKCGFDSLVHGIEANMETLLALRKTPGFLEEHAAALEMVIEAQRKLLETMLSEK